MRGAKTRQSKDSARACIGPSLQRPSSQAQSRQIGLKCPLKRDTVLLYETETNATTQLGILAERGGGRHNQSSLEHSWWSALLMSTMVRAMLLMLVMDAGQSHSVHTILPPPSLGYPLILLFLLVFRTSSDPANPLVMTLRWGIGRGYEHCLGNVWETAQTSIVVSQRNLQELQVRSGNRRGGCSRGHVCPTSLSIFFFCVCVSHHSWSLARCRGCLLLASLG